MIKRIVPVLILFLLSTAQIHAQDETAWDAKFAAGGGFTPAWFVPDLSMINQKVESFGVGKFSTSGFFATGGTGFISIAIIKNIRLGGMGLGGSMKNSSLVNGKRREAVYSLGMGGVTAEYTMPFIKNIAVSAGVILGGGGNSLELYENQGPESWDDAWKDVTSAQGQTKHRTISNSYFLLAPTLNVEIPVYRFFAIRLGAGYNFALGNNWKVDNDQELTNVPKELNSNSLFIQAGIFIGFFNY
ncbi:MAG: hypothetical protein HF314_05305 [Ignavibacteria bacterium]|jgi:hypothetical protein|nr:hypothetical protein [Ignavibacteria bacterium]MCU7502468.1 hypothetical protein [Ignavibacteria bacterium]MCU7514967.1 hypothetical protein [Ignavibacteria bacterium]